MRKVATTAILRTLCGNYIVTKWRKVEKSGEFPKHHLNAPLTPRHPPQTRYHSHSTHKKTPQARTAHPTRHTGHIPRFWVFLGVNSTILLPFCCLFCCLFLKASPKNPNRDKYSQFG